MNRVIGARHDRSLVSHAPAYADGFYIAGGDGGYGDLRSFGIPHVREEVSLDRTFSERLAVTLADRGIYTTGTTQGRGGFDHGTLIPLRFIHQRLLTLSSF